MCVFVGLLASGFGGFGSDLEAQLNLTRLTTGQKRGSTRRPETQPQTPRFSRFGVLVKPIIYFH